MLQFFAKMFFVFSLVFLTSSVSHANEFICSLVEGEGWCLVIPKKPSPPEAEEGRFESERMNSGERMNFSEHMHSGERIHSIEGQGVSSSRSSEEKLALIKVEKNGSTQIDLENISPEELETFNQFFSKFSGWDQVKIWLVSTPVMLKLKKELAARDLVNHKILEKVTSEALLQRFGNKYVAIGAVLVSVGVVSALASWVYTKNMYAGAIVGTYVTMLSAALGVPLYNYSSSWLSQAQWKVADAVSEDDSKKMAKESKDPQKFLDQMPKAFVKLNANISWMDQRARQNAKESADFLRMAFQAARDRVSLNQAEALSTELRKLNSRLQQESVPAIELILPLSSRAPLDISEPLANGIFEFVGRYQEFHSHPDLLQMVAASPFFKGEYELLKSYELDLTEKIRRRLKDMDKDHHPVYDIILAALEGKEVEDFKEAKDSKDSSEDTRRAI